MAISGCMSCLKTCGYLCGVLAALNIWFWIGMTVFNSMDNPWIKKEIIKLDSYTEDASKYTTIFGMCVLVSTEGKRLLTIHFFFSSISSAALGASDAPRPVVIKTRTSSNTTAAVVPVSKTKVCTVPSTRLPKT